MDSTHGGVHTKARLDELLDRLLELRQGCTEPPTPDLEAVLDEINELLARRRFEHGSYEELFVETNRLPALDDETPARLLLTATGLTREGDPEPLGYMSGESDAVRLSLHLLLDLRARGLADVTRVVAAADTGIDEILPAIFPEAAWAEMPQGTRPDWLRVP